jgi:hypothetical protein
MKGLEYAEIMMELAKATTELNMAHKQAVATMQAMANGVDETSKLTIQGYTNIIGGTMGKRLVVSDVKVNTNTYVFEVQNRDTFESQIVHLDRMPEVQKRGHGFDAYRLHIPYGMLPPGASVNESWTLVGKGLLRNKPDVLNCLWKIVGNSTNLDDDKQAIGYDPNTFRITYKN